MGNYKLGWLLENRVILLQLEGAYSEVLFNEQVQALKALVAPGTAPMYLIVDTTGATTIPKNFREPLNILTANRLEGQITWAIFVTSNPLFRFLGSIAGNLTSIHFRPAASLEEAIEVLLRINPGLEEALRSVDLTPYVVPNPS